MLPVLGGVVWSKESDKRFHKCPSCHVKGWINHPTCRTLLHANRDSKFLSVQQIQIQLVQQRELRQLLLKKMLNCGQEGLETMRAHQGLESAPPYINLWTKEFAILEVWSTKMLFCAIRLFSRTNNSEQTTYKCKKRGKPCLNVHG